MSTGQVFVSANFKVEGFTFIPELRFENAGANIFADAALKIGGTNPLPVFAAYALDSLSTVEYAGSTQSVRSISALGTYGNLVISTAGIKTANPLVFRDWLLEKFEHYRPVR